MIELHDLQANVVRGFGAQQSAYMFVRFDDGPALMGELAGRVATAKFLPSRRPSSTWRCRGRVCASWAWNAMSSQAS